MTRVVALGIDCLCSTPGWDVLLIGVAMFESMLLLRSSDQRSRCYGTVCESFDQRFLRYY